jgi:hypothetical protein
MQIYRSKVPFYVNISNPGLVQTFLAWFNRPVLLHFFLFEKKKKEQEKLDFQSSSRGYNFLVKTYASCICKTFISVIGV